MHHLDAYAADIGVSLQRRVPRFRVSFGRTVAEPYGILCPDTSDWMAEMRRWPHERFEALAGALSGQTALRWLFLRPEHTFAEMMSLIEHAELVVTNDSGPCHIAQAMGREAVVLFGCTSPQYVLVSETAHGIIGSYPCNGCRHLAADRGMRCAEPMCVTSISVEQVVEVILSALSGDRAPIVTEGARTN